MSKKLLSGPYLLWMAAFTIIPLALIVYYGLTDKTGAFTMANVMAIATAEHSKALWLSLGLSLISTVICLLLAYPLAMILRNRGIGKGSFVVFIFILPMWMNFLLRTLAWQTLLEKNGDKVILPEVTENALASPFGFLLTCREGISREKIVSALEEKGIQTRPLFAGNLLRHPCFDTLEEGVDYRVIGELPVTDRILQDTFWVGVYPGLTAEQLAYEGEVLYDAIRKA